MSEKVTREDMNAVMKFIVAGYYCDIFNNFKIKQADDKNYMENFNITVTENEILKLVANGLSDEQIAKEMHISNSIISTNIDEIFKKLSNQNKTQPPKFAW